ncbi:thioesterase family protein [Robertmurraya sp. DFI.2.37]|uniref:acyl-CoA thioesterase n=1 Tax=Robertmurraya sp. DFI.2.37 TaxID=3031819 RepID=UPI0012443C40|nr:thioesterase family protein [Robertmurraya sp. DFI.2.37]MDF1506933.1 thioesterase family protein [Robertmurraya sp. DFI.2.37]
MSRISYIEDFATWEHRFHFYYPVKVRFSETDMFGHLNNTIPFTYYEEARIEYFKSKGMMTDWLDGKSEAMIVVADLQCDFLKQVYFDEQLRIYVRAHSVGTSSVDIHYMGKRENEEICFVGRGTIVQVSKKTGKSIPWSSEVKAAMLECETIQ